MASRSPPRSALQEQRGARKSCEKSESTEEVGQLVRSQTIAFFRTEFTSGERRLTAWSCPVPPPRISSRLLVGQRMLTRPRDVARVFSVWPVFRRGFSQAQATRCGKRRVYRCARTCAHQRNRVALARDSPADEQSDNCRNTPTRQKTRGPERRI